MWKHKRTALAAAAVVAGLSIPSVLAQGYYDDSGYDDHYGTGQYGTGQYGNGQYGADPYNRSYGDAGYYGQQAPDQYGAGQYGAGVSFDYFYDTLAPHGQWFRHPRWGDVWRPINVSPDFRPYYQGGYWQNTLEFGWTWVSDYAWGDIVFHYGRWVHDPYEGWIWIPGYTWAPSWVIWRSGGGHLGWFPMPPTNSFLLGIELYSNDWRHWDQGFGYANWYGSSYGSSWLSLQWVFVDERRFGHRNFHRWVAPRHRVQHIVDNSVNITNYVTENNYIVNRSLRGRRFDRAGGGRHQARPAREVLRRDSRRTRADTGRRIHQRERRAHGGNPNASARERLAALPRADRRRDTRLGNDRRNTPRANGQATTEQRARQPRVRDENTRPQRPRREQAAQQPRVRGENRRNTPRANGQATTEQRARQPRVRDENVRPQRPQVQQRARAPQRAQSAQRPQRTERARPQRPRREQAAPRVQQAQPVQRAERPAPQQRTRSAAVERPNPPRQRAARQARSGNDNTRPERPARGRRNR